MKTIAPYIQTPGPWAIDWTLSDGDRYWVEAKPGDAPIVVARVNEMRDAQLIAAAPELLDMLRKADAWISMYHDKPGHDAASRHMTDAIRAAIAKATGGQA